MFLTRRDLAGAIVTALVVLVYVANVQSWWYLGSNRWAAVTMLAIGAIGCPLGARLERERLTSLPIVLLGTLGMIALVLAVIAIVTGAQWALLTLALVVVTTQGNRQAALGQAGGAAATGPRYTVIETQGFNLLVTDNTAKQLYYYSTDKDAAVGSPLKLRASLDLTQIGKEEIAIKTHNLENMKAREKK